MPLAPAIAASLSAGLPARTKGLYIDGLDVLRQPGTPGNLYGVPLDTIVVTESGPGDVSTLAFTIDDPLGVISLASGQSVRYVDLVTGVPLFLGFIDTWAPSPVAIGREIEVTCIGIEAVLDWIYIPAFTIALAIPDIYNDYIAHAIGAAPGIGFSLNYAYVVGGVGPSTQARPMGGYGAQSLTFPLAVAGGTLRQVMATLSAQLIGQQTEAGAAPPASSWVGTVDFYGGLRWWDESGTYNTRPTDWVSTAIGPVNKPSGLKHISSTGDAVRQVYVIGGNAAGTGMVSDGSGLIGPTAVLEDSTITTAGGKIAAAAAYIGAHGQTVEGGFTAEEYLTAGTIGAERHAGGQFVITNAEVGLAAYTVNASKITKTYYAATELWVIEYGARDSFATKYLRRLTAGSVI